MHRMCRHFAGLMVLAGVLVACPGAWARAHRPPPFTNLDYAVSAASGTVGVSFASDPATCAAGGRCGMSGSETYSLGLARRFPSFAFVSIISQGRSRFTFGTVEIGAGSSSASVALPGGGAPCIDELAGQIFDLSLTGVGHRLVLTLGDSLPPRTPGGVSFLPSGGADPFDTHCPGPRLNDLLTLPPPGGVPLQALRLKALQLDLSSTSGFTEAGFKGTLTTTLHVTLKRGKIGRGVQKLLNHLS